ncbi:MAG: LysR family transcriptional regulator [Tistrella sp.]|jgi:DNA-binding transcriptional LysR family regulator|nr:MULTISPECIES: LysR family transcriptional regulator [Tistrella]MAD40036.1 LysR family transcriptional regulator [Tistrella sp.]MAM76116.1 LysR family transcriptional regulator [Tistrella sp.]MBA77222.1 LysR family transcriptional regulator [Tistrella sp.]HAE46434.1 LysR family transcriptional regulator [Tistrella mobilis]
MSLNFRHVKYFVATATLGQVSRAAKELSISQSAITAAIKELEAETGSRLFDRTAHGMELTDAGRRFLAAGYRILASIEEALQPGTADDAFSGTLSVAASYTVLGYFLPQHLERLERRYPNLRIQLYELSREMIEDGLVTNRFDMAVVLTSNVNNPELVTETLMSSQRRLWLPAGHPLLGRDRVRFGDIAEEPYIMLTVDEAAHSALKYWNRTQHQPNIRLRTSSIEAVRSIVANGQGISILSDMVYRPWSLEGKRIETVVMAEEVPPMNVGLAWRQGVDLSPAMRLFRGYFAEVYQTPQSMLPR